MERQHGVAAVVLAAGESRRFGGRKQLAELDGRTLLEHVLELARTAGLDPVVAVVPVWLTRPRTMNDPTLRWVRNPHPERGLSHSLRLGFGALPDETGAAVILLGDQPTISPDTVRALVAARGERPIVATRAAGRLAAPVLVERTHFSVVDEPAGDIGLRELLNAHPEWVLAVEVPEHAPDVDTPADLAGLAATELRPCPGCGARLPGDPEGPKHHYIGASSPCWLLHAELLVRMGERGLLSRHVVDAYAAQHPGVDGRQQRQSVAVHLTALCHRFEHGLDPDLVTRLTQRILAGRPDWPWLAPPRDWAMTVADVAAAAADPSALAEAADGYARSVWAAWVAHHVTVRRWATEAIGDRG